MMAQEVTLKYSSTKEDDASSIVSYGTLKVIQASTANHTNSSNAIMQVMMTTSTQLEINSMEELGQNANKSMELFIQYPK